MGVQQCREQRSGQVWKAGPRAALAHCGVLPGLACVAYAQVGVVFGLPLASTLGWAGLVGGCWHTQNPWYTPFSHTLACMRWTNMYEPYG